MVKLVFGEQLQIGVDYGSSEGLQRFEIDHAGRQTIPSDSNTLTKKVFTHVEPALIYDNFIRITTYTGIFRAFQAKINV